MKDCLFCKIISGEIPSYKIYEDGFTYAFLDISNDGIGHILVVPKKHYANIGECEKGVLSKAMESVQFIINHLICHCGFEGANVINNMGECAGQSVHHLHFHIFPRKQGDGLQVFPTLPKNEEALETLCEKFKIEIKKEVKNNNNIILYTDGACSGNPGMGGWGAILMYNGAEKVISGGEELTTNNRMELTAVIKGLEKIKGKQNVDVYSDSAYVVNAFLQHWVDNWQNNGWKTSNGTVQNIDLWQDLLSLVAKHNVTWHKVKGHADNEYNNRCDALARGEIENLRNEKK